MFKLALLALAMTLASASTQADWLVYKRTHNKVYTGDEDVIRRFIWKSNLQKIQAHNEKFAQGISSYYMGENQFADMTVDEVTAMMNGLKVNRELNPGTFETGLYKGILADTVDWRTKGYVTPVKDQGQCGSCWAFSTTGSLEGQHFKASGKLVSLSESNLVDCTRKYGNLGCDGGYMDNAFKYVIHNKGIDTEAGYPYVDQERQCAFKRADVGATEASYKDVESGSEDALQKAVAEIGPISVGIDASQASFQLYSGGVYEEPACNKTNMDHAVLAVGYGTEGGKDYWIVKNSWGKSWGLEGYILMGRNNDNQCGIATMASYPVV
jgi:cathepsin L